MQNLFPGQREWIEGVTKSEVYLVMRQPFIFYKIFKYAQ